VGQRPSTALGSDRANSSDGSLQERRRSKLTKMNGKERPLTRPFYFFNIGPVFLVNIFPRERFVPFPTILVQIEGHFTFPVEMVPRNHSL
jgi:hypothetical protein